MKKIGLYIHIPFCQKKCLYCDFNSYEGKINKAESYIKALIQEINLYKMDHKFNFKTIFIGGGTPTLINCFFMGEILEAIKENVEHGAEISIECNPGTLNKKNLEAYKSFGINRLSIGLQAWQDHLLQSIGRIHSREEFINSYKAAKTAGFHNINIDLMFALPGQTMEMWEETLNQVCSLGVSHISCYSLKLEEGTKFYDMQKKGQIVMPDEDMDRDMYHRTVEVLDSYGLKQYEISNFAKPGFECKHNLVYWHNEEYLGVGAGSHSKLFGKRFWNLSTIDDYIETINSEKLPVLGEEQLNTEDNMWESLFLGLRLNEGVNIKEFEIEYKMDFFQKYGKKIDDLIKNDLLVKTAGNIVLTSKGRDLSNIVFVELS